MRSLRRLLLGALLAAFPAMAPLIASPQKTQPPVLEIVVSMAEGSAAPWDRSFRADLERLAAAPPPGVEISWSLHPPRRESAAARIARLAGAGRLVWTHSHLSPAARSALAAHPGTLFVVAGAGNASAGGNQLWVMKRLHEPAYLLGALAAEVTRTGRIGVIQTVDGGDVNDMANAFLAGARAIRPEIETRVHRLDAWSAPRRARAAIRAQAETGVDVVFQMEGDLPGCAEAGLLCLTAFTEESAVAPDHALAAAVADWTPDLDAAIALWAGGPPYAAPPGAIRFGLAEGGARLAVNTPLLRKRLGADRAAQVAARLAALEARIRSGALRVPIDVSAPATAD